MGLAKFQLKTWKWPLTSFASLFLFGLAPSFGQTFQPELILNRYPTFSASDIQAAGIKRIRIKELTKPSSRPVYDQNIRFNYYFDQKGRLTGYKKTYPGFRGKIDTIQIIYDYQNGKIYREVEVLGKYQRSVEFQPVNDSIVHRVIKTKRGKEAWELFETEKIKRIQFRKGTAEMIGGLYDVPYQKIITEWNDDSTAIKQETWNGSRIQSKRGIELRNDSLIKYEYEDLLNHKATRIQFPKSYSNASGIWCENKDCLTFSIVVKGDGWPKGWIFMNEETEDMIIWEIDYF